MRMHRSLNVASLWPLFTSPNRCFGERKHSVSNTATLWDRNIYRLIESFIDFLHPVHWDLGLLLFVRVNSWADSWLCDWLI